MKKSIVYLMASIFLCISLDSTSLGAELSNEVEENYKSMGMTQEEILSVKEELRDVENPNYITDTEKEFYIKRGIKTEDMELMQQDSEKEIKDVELNENELRAAHGTYPIEEGIILVTKDKLGGVVPIGHAAITTSRDYVIESNPGVGVHRGANDWDETKDTCYGLKVHTLTKEERFKVAEWSVEQLPCLYNYNFYNVETRERFYCSHLVWAGFKDLYGVDLNGGMYGKAIYPPEMIDSGYVYRIYIK